MAMSDLFPIIYDKSFQESFKKKNVGLMTANFMLNSEANSYGKTIQKPLNITVPTPRFLVAGNDHVIDNPNPSTETMDINQLWEASFRLLDTDLKQSNVKTLAADFGDKYAQSLSNKVDADILYEAVNSTSIVDDGSLGGTPTNGITMSESNIRKLSTQATQKLQLLDVDTSNMIAVVPAQYMTFLTDYLASRNTDMGDEVGKNGFAGSYNAVKHYISNNLTGQVNMSWGINPTNGLTVLINGVTFTFVTTIGATAGNVLIGGSAALTAANLNTLLNAPEVTTATGVALTGDNLNKIKASIVSVNNAGTLTVRFKWFNKAIVAAGTSAPTFAKYITHGLIAKKGHPTCIMQMGFGTYEANKEPKQIGTVNHLRKVLYGVKSFKEDRDQMVDVLLDSTSF